MEASNLRTEESSALLAKSSDLRKQLETLFLQKATGGLENPKKIMEVKRDLARVLTVLKEKSFQESSK